MKPMDKENWVLNISIESFAIENLLCKITNTIANMKQIIIVIKLNE